MLEDMHPVLQTFLGTLFTWGMTAAGAGLVFVFSNTQRKVLDGSLGFAAGVMIAASYWSLLAPAIEMAELSGSYGSTGQWAFIPVAVGFILGAVFVYTADLFIPHCGQFMGPENGVSTSTVAREKSEDLGQSILLTVQSESVGDNLPQLSKMRQGSDKTRQRRQVGQAHSDSSLSNPGYKARSQPNELETSSIRNAINWRRILLLIIAITIHNIPEGLAVGVGFGAIGKTKAATLENARNLAFGIGIQNFPEGLAVSLPLRGSGVSALKSFWYGQLSGILEPVAGILGAIAVAYAEPILPYALAFAAGAMIFVVVDDIIPESQTCGNGKLASWGAILGFVVMMSLDVGLG